MNDTPKNHRLPVLADDAAEIAQARLLVPPQEQVPLIWGAAICRRQWPSLPAAAGGADPVALVTMRHEGAAHDSFVPMPLRIPAAQGAKRAEARARLAEHRAGNRADSACVRDRTPVGGFQMVEGGA